MDPGRAPSAKLQILDLLQYRYFFRCKRMRATHVRDGTAYPFVIPGVAASEATFFSRYTSHSSKSAGPKRRPESARPKTRIRHVGTLSNVGHTVVVSNAAGVPEDRRGAA